MARQTSAEQQASECDAICRMLAAVREQVHRVVVGQDDLIDRILTGLLCGGHLLLEGVPGLAKTLCATTLARTMDATFRRIQFTPDLLPADLLGAEVYSPRTEQFSVHRGPIFANIILADEVNRAPAKVQSALLEAMQERQVTIAGETFPLPEPFMVIATQNPIEQEGTYPLAEAQMDRFLLKLRVPYPQRAEELQILDRMATAETPDVVDAVLQPTDVLRIRAAAEQVHAAPRIKDYVLDIVRATRNPNSETDWARYVAWGASPRAAVHMLMAARARALLKERGYVAPDDVQAVAADVLRHRLVLTFEAEAEGVRTDALIARLLAEVPVR